MHDSCSYMEEMLKHTKEIVKAAHVNNLEMKKMVKSTCIFVALIVCGYYGYKIYKNYNKDRKIKIVKYKKAAPRNKYFLNSNNTGNLQIPFRNVVLPYENLNELSTFYI